MNRLLPRAALVTMAACASAPPPTEPDRLDLAIPDQWTAVQAAADETVRDDWWTVFGDAQLDQLVDEALAYNRDLRAAIARLDAATADRTIAGAAGLPQVDATFDPHRSRRLFLGFPFGGGGVPSSTTTTYGLSLNVTWELDVWGRVRGLEGAAIADVQAAAADVSGARTSLCAQVCRAWFAAVEARQQLALSEATVASTRATAEDVRDRYRRGVRPALDVHQAETNLANAQATVQARRHDLQRALHQLDLLVGRYPRGEATPADVLPTALGELPAGLPSQLLQRRPDLSAAERRLAAAGCRVDAARAALYPRIGLTASGGTTSTELEDLVDSDFRVWSLGANLLQPLFYGGALRADVDRSLARQAEELANYGSAVLRAFVEVEDALASETLLVDRYEALQRASLHARQARDLARERWQLGLTDFLAVADGQRQSYLTDAALITLERLRIDNRIQLYLALGGGFAVETHGDNP
jgi:NodT family efflux transporter outer membrane factor (OMF) lipoprotein